MCAKWKAFASLQRSWNCEETESHSSGLDLLTGRRPSRPQEGTRHSGDDSARDQAATSVIPGNGQHTWEISYPI